MTRRFLILVLASAALFPLLGLADKSLEGRACRSVHLGYSAPEAVAFYNELTVAQSAEGSYFMACGWDRGYFGIQELDKGKKVVIFSVWDTAEGDDPQKVPAEKQVKLVTKGTDVRTGRFGNEGTGGQSFLTYDWKIGDTYRFLVTSAIDPADSKRTVYTGHFFRPENKSWELIASFSCPNGGRNLGGYYSFVEDFRRDRVSLTKTRRANFGNGWVKTPNGEWEAITRARFTGDSNPAQNIDAGLEKDRFFLATGGKTENSTTKLKERITRTAEPGKPPVDLPK